MAFLLEKYRAYLKKLTESSVDTGRIENMSNMYYAVSNLCKVIIIGQICSV
jgi:C4-dicarboxylate transporter